MMENLTELTLVDGIPVDREGKTLHYRQVHLCETTVADERKAVRLAERVVTVGGQQKLMVSDADFRYAMTMLHIERLECEGSLVIDKALIDLDLFGKLSNHDLGLIESRVFLMEMAAELRYGNLTQQQFDALLEGQLALTQGAQSPQPVGQASAVGQADRVAKPGPALLADFAGPDAPGPAAGHGQ